MKRIITIGMMCIFLCSFSSCMTYYENITFTKNSSEVLYQGDTYYETAIFTATEHDGIENENDIELGLYYSFPFSTRFFSDNSENPVFIYTTGSKTSMYLKQDYDYSTDVFVVENTDSEIVWADIFHSNDVSVVEKNGDESVWAYIVQYKQVSLVLPNSIRVEVFSKQYPRIRAILEVARVGNQWYLSWLGEKDVWTPSEEFIKILSDNGIV